MLHERLARMDSLTKETPQLRDSSKASIAGIKATLKFQVTRVNGNE